MDLKDENQLPDKENEQAQNQDEIANTSTEVAELTSEHGENPVAVADYSLGKRFYVLVTSLLVVLGMLLTFVVTYIIMSTSHQTELDTLKNNYSAEINSIGEFRSVIELYNSLPPEHRNIELYQKLAYLDYYYRTNYVGGIVDEEELVYMVLNGYVVGAGDMYGGYYTSDEFQTVIGDTEGNSVGIGVYITADTEINGIRISYVMKDGPANKAGLLPGDIITHVDGKTVKELGYYIAIDKIKGEPNTTVNLGVYRDGAYMEKTVTREKFNVDSVIYTRHETQKDIGVIRVVEFSNLTGVQFIEAVKTAIDVDGCTKLVFDLRGNPGGTLQSVLQMLDFLLPEGIITTQRFASGEVIEHKSDNEGEELEALYKDKDIKMAVLVNKDTASAAELFTSALMDHGKAIVVGETTYGKGCGQNVIPLSDGSGFVFTTFMYDPPKSPNYNGVGIKPNIEVALSEEASKKNLFELKHSQDDQLKAAIDALNK